MAQAATAQIVPALEGNSPGDRAYRELRAALVRCEYLPGQRLAVEALSAALDVSSSPVREALHRLSVEGFVVALDQRGFRVAPITIAGINDLTRVRVLLECETLRDSIAAGDDGWEASVVAAAYQLDKIERMMPDGPAPLDDRWSASHRALHLALYAGSSSPLLIRQSTTLFDLADRYRRFSAVSRTRPRSKRSEHRQIVDAVVARDGDLASMLLQRHIEATARNVVQALQRSVADADHVG